MEENKNIHLGKEKQQFGSVEREKNHQESSKTTVSIDGRLLVKLKIPKTTKGIEEVASPAKKIHFCQECNKSFSSGKALGGHMSSAHVQAREYLKKLKFNKSKFKRDGPSSDAATKETLCSICGKNFPSRKSLFGHMRCHPDREWRGMEPPKEQQEKKINRDLQQEKKINRDLSPSLSNHDDEEEDGGDEDEDEDNESLQSDNQAYYYVDEIANQADCHADYHVDLAADEAAAATLATVVDVVDLTESFSSWTVKGKRGRKGLLEHRLDTDPPSDEEEKKMRDAVDHLISLVNGDSLRPIYPKEEHKSDSSSTSRGQIEEALNGASGSKKKRVDQVHPAARDGRDYPVKKRRFTETAADDSEETLDEVLDKVKGKVRINPEFIDEISPNSESRDVGLAGNYGKNKFFSTYRLDKMKIEPQNHNFYDEFSTGNVVMKNKKRGHRAKTMDSEIEGDITPVDQMLDAEETPEKFKCSTCGKSFSTHQALGGHRSSHNKLKVNVQNTADGTSPYPVGYENRANSVSEAIETYEIGGEVASKLVENIHQCKICNKTFPTGQALGGHKRCHWPGLSSQVASPEAGETQASVRKVLQFDLNKPAEMEDAYFSGYGNATGYASCS